MKPAAQKLEQPNDPVPGVHPGDEVFFKNREGQAMSGKVLCHGKDGYTAKCAAGKSHRVRWNEHTGHKTRKPHKVTLVEEGEDGAIVQHEDGKRVVLFGYPDGSPEFTKAQAPRVLFLKAGVANRPGLILTDVTDRAGHQTKRWKRAGEEPKGPGRMPGKPKEAPQRGRGGHEAQVGEHVAFEPGEGEHGHGKVVARGKSGATIETVGGKRHQVTWDRLKQGHRFDPHSYGKSKMSDHDIERIHEHAGRPVKHEAHTGVTDENSAYASADMAHRQFKRALMKKGGVADKLGAEVFVEDAHGAMEHLREHPDKPVLMVAPLKGRVRAREKAEKDSWAGVKDLVRGSFIVPTLDHVPKALAALKESGIKVTRIKNRFHKPAGAYRDILMNVKMPNGHVAELQLHIAPMIHAKDTFGGHGHYQAFRAVSEKQEQGGTPPVTKEELASMDHANAHMNELYGQAWAGARGTV